MGRPLICSDNVFNTRIYPDHTLAASTTATDKSVLFLASGRRIRELTGWFASALNAEAYVGATFDQARAFDLLWIDRDHNLDGESISVRISDDGFATYQTIGPQTVPSSPVPMSHLYDGNIVRTNEGALLWWLDLQVGWAVRVYVVAMGTGLRPEIAGLSVGKSWAPEHAAEKPYSYGRWNLTHASDRSPLGQDSSGDIGRFRSADLKLRIASWGEYATALYPIEELYLGRRPTVIVPDDERAEGAVLTLAPPGMIGFEIVPGQNLPEITISWEESQPVLL